nr:MAG TPA: hypothetical protein [Bacteriophage sp.]
MRRMRRFATKSLSLSLSTGSTSGVFSCVMCSSFRARLPVRGGD